MPRGVPHSDETRAAVLAALLAGQGVATVAAEYRVDRKTVREWAAAASIAIVPSSPEVPHQNEGDIPALVAGYLQESLITLRVQSVFFRDKEWLNKQPAADLAVLHGVMADKAIRILSAIEAARQASQEGG